MEGEFPTVKDLDFRGLYFAIEFGVYSVGNAHRDLLRQGQAAGGAVPHDPKLQAAVSGTGMEKAGGKANKKDALKRPFCNI